MGSRERRSGADRLPDFLGIGAPQSGTTWLHRCLQRHPALFLPRPKEVNYFDRNWGRGLDWYARRFADAAPAARVGEITPSYGALARHRIAEVRRLLPDVRLVYLARDPIERGWSRARRRHARAHGGRAEGLGLEALRAYEANQSISPGAYEPGVMKGDHLRVLENWLDHFPAEQLLLLDFDEIPQRPRELIARVLRHLGVDEPDDWSAFPLTRRINANPPLPMPQDCRAFLEERYRADIDAFRARTGLGAGWSPPLATSGGIRATR